MKRLLLERLLIGLAVMVLSLGLVARAMALTDTGTHTVTITVEEIAQIDVVGGNVLFTFNQAGTTAGSLPTVSDDTATSLSWTSNVAANSRKITAELDQNSATGIVLKVTVTKAGGNGTAGSQITLTLAAQDVFSGITNENVTGNTLTYNATLSTMIAPVTDARTVTYTLLAAAA